MIAKRLFDLLASAVGLMVLAPLLLCIALAIKFESPGPVFFRQERVGRGGKLFRIHKFRTMVPDAERRGPQITVGKDTRVTEVGTVLRRYKLDELAQLLDIFFGDMSFVGPRPEVPKYVSYYSEDDRNIIFSVRPGITDWASINFRDENDILAKAVDPHDAYVEEIIPIKIKYYRDYVKRNSFFGDIHIIIETIWAVVKSG